MALILDSAGNAIYPIAPTGSYLANINIRHTVADAGASAVFAMRNPAASTKTCFIRAIRGRVTFDGTAVAATSCAYEFIRFSGGDPSTGTTLPRVKKRSSYANSQILDANAQQKSGVLTMTSVTYDPNGPFNVVRLPTSVTSGIAGFDIDLLTAGLSYEGFELAVGEGLAIRLNVAAIIGLGIAGSVEWDER